MAGMAQKQLPKHYLELDKGRTDGFELLQFKEDGSVDMEAIERILKGEQGDRKSQILRELNYWNENVATEELKKKSFGIDILSPVNVASTLLGLPVIGGIASGQQASRNNMIFASATAQKKADEAAGFAPWTPGSKQPDDQAAVAAQEEADKKILEQDATDKFLLAAQRADIVRPSFGTGQMFAQPEPMLAPGMGAYKPKRNGILKARGIL